MNKDGLVYRDNMERAKENIDWIVLMYRNGASIRTINKECEKIGFNIYNYNWHKLISLGYITSDDIKEHERNRTEQLRVGRQNKRNQKTAKLETVALSDEVLADKMLLASALSGYKKAAAHEVVKQQGLVASLTQVDEVTDAIACNRNYKAQYEILAAKLLEIDTVDEFYNCFGDYKLSLDQIKGVDYLLTLVSDKERKVVKWRYMMGENIPLEFIGDKLGVTRERARQIENRALTKMRYGNNLDYIKLGYNRKKALVKIGNPEDLMIAELMLSKRTLNALTGAGITYIRDIKSREQLKMIRSLGVGCINEITNKLNSVGVALV